MADRFPSLEDFDSGGTWQLVWASPEAPSLFRGCSELGDVIWAQIFVGVNAC